MIVCTIFFNIFTNFGLSKSDLECGEDALEVRGVVVEVLRELVLTAHSGSEEGGGHSVRSVVEFTPGVDPAEMFLSRSVGEPSGDVFPRVGVVPGGRSARHDADGRRRVANVWTSRFPDSMIHADWRFETG